MSSIQKERTDKIKEIIIHEITQGDLSGMKGMIF